MKLSLNIWCFFLYALQEESRNEEKKGQSAENNVQMHFNQMPRPPRASHLQDQATWPVVLLCHVMRRTPSGLNAAVNIDVLALVHYQLFQVERLQPSFWADAAFRHDLFKVLKFTHDARFSFPPHCSHFSCLLFDRFSSSFNLHVWNKWSALSHFPVMHWSFLCIYLFI